MRLEKCCFCNNVHRGAKIIAGVGILVSLALIIYIVFLSSTPAHAGFISALVTLITSMALYYGITQEKPGFIMVWMIIDMIKILLLFGLVIFLVILVIGHVLASEQMEYVEPGVTIGAALTYAVLSMYFWLVVLSCYRDMLDELKRRDAVRERKYSQSIERSGPRLSICA